MVFIGHHKPCVPVDCSVEDAISRLKRGRTVHDSAVNPFLVELISCRDCLTYQVAITEDDELTAILTEDIDFARTPLITLVEERLIRALPGYDRHCRAAHGHVMRAVILRHVVHDVLHLVGISRDKGLDIRKCKKIVDLLMGCAILADIQAAMGRDDLQVGPVEGVHTLLTIYLTQGEDAEIRPEDKDAWLLGKTCDGHRASHGGSVVLCYPILDVIVRIPVPETCKAYTACEVTVDGSDHAAIRTGFPVGSHVGICQGLKGRLPGLAAGSRLGIESERSRPDHHLYARHRMIFRRSLLAFFLRMRKTVPCFILRHAEFNQGMEGILAISTLKRKRRTMIR